MERLKGDLMGQGKKGRVHPKLPMAFIPRREPGLF